MVINRKLMKWDEAVASYKQALSKETEKACSKIGELQSDRAKSKQLTHQQR